MFVYWKIACWNNKKHPSLPKFPFSGEVSLCQFSLGLPERLVSSSTQRGTQGWSERNRPKQIGDCQLSENGEDLWKDACGASRKASLLPLATVVARTGTNPIYLELEDKKLVSSLESRGWCIKELKGCFTSLLFGTYSLHLTKALFCYMLDLLSGFSASVGSAGAVVGYRQLKHPSVNVRSHQQRENFLTNFSGEFLPSLFAIIK